MFVKHEETGRKRGEDSGQKKGKNFPKLRIISSLIQVYQLVSRYYDHTPSARRDQ